MVLLGRLSLDLLESRESGVLLVKHCQAHEERRAHLETRATGETEDLQELKENGVWLVNLERQEKTVRRDLQGPKEIRGRRA